MADSLADGLDSVTVDDGNQRGSDDSNDDSGDEPNQSDSPLTPEKRLNYKAHVEHLDRLVYDPAKVYNLDDWNGLKPSTSSVQYGIKTVEVYKPGVCSEQVFLCTTANLKRLRGDFKRKSKNTDDVTMDWIETVGRKYNCLTGKLIIVSKWRDVDALWKDIVKAVLSEDELVSRILLVNVTVRDMSRKNPYTTAKINLVTKDFTDKHAIEAAVQDLRKFGIQRRITYKPDIFTELKLTKDMPYPIPPAIYDFPALNKPRDNRPNNGSPNGKYNQKWPYDETRR